MVLVGWGLIRAGVDEKTNPITRLIVYMSIINTFTISSEACLKNTEFLIWGNVDGVFYFLYKVWIEKFSKLVETLRETSNKNFVQNVNSKFLGTPILWWSVQFLGWIGLGVHCTVSLCLAPAPRQGHHAPRWAALTLESVAWIQMTLEMSWCHDVRGGELTSGPSVDIEWALSYSDQETQRLETTLR